MWSATDQVKRKGSSGWPIDSIKARVKIGLTRVMPPRMDGRILCPVVGIQADRSPRMLHNMRLYNVSGPSSRRLLACSISAVMSAASLGSGVVASLVGYTSQATTKIYAAVSPLEILTA